MDTPEKVNLESMSISEDKREGLRLLLPEVFSDEGKLDFDKLRRALGEWAEAGNERFGLNWHGKAECMKVIMETSVATLSPARAESVDFDNTNNLFIEGDNLEVLKLLQKSYFGKVKMIYIDPPYNTGKEFIYPDKYSESLDTYLHYTGQVDGNGHKFATNTEATGRYHSRWLSMMYPRLYLARNLLREDGVIFISIDDHEQANLKKLCDELFGEENVEVLLWKKAHERYGTMKNTKSVRIDHDYVLVVHRMEKSLAKVPLLPERASDTKPKKDGKGKYYVGYIARGEEGSNKDHKNYYSVTTPSGEVFAAQFEVSKDEFLDLEQRGYVHWSNNVPYRKIYLDETEIKTASSLLKQSGSTYEGKKEMLCMFGEEIFDNPKPTKLLQMLMHLGCGKDDIVLDFFAGSGTTAHAVMQLNKADGGHRQFICVQLPERLDDSDQKKKDNKAAIDLCNNMQVPRTIAEISKERVRRAAKKIAEEQNGHMDIDGNGKLDLGFKVFKLTQSNFKPWESNAAKVEDLEQQVVNHVDYLNPASTPEEILYELLLKSGCQLTTPISTIKVVGKDVFSINEGALLICLDKNLTTETIKGIAALNPKQVICLDDGFNGDSEFKVNAAQIFQIRARQIKADIVFKTV